MANERFIVTTAMGGRRRQVIWDTRDPLPLDHPVSWTLEKGATGLRVVGLGRAIDLGGQNPGAPRTLELPSQFPDQPPRPITLMVRRANAVLPAYSQATSPQAEKTISDQPETRICVSQGSRISIQNFQPVADRMVGKAEKTRVFALKKLREGYRIQATTEDVHLKLGESAPEPLRKRATKTLTEDELLRTTILWRMNWWKLKRVPVPEILVTLDRGASSEMNLERLWFNKLSRNLLLGALAVGTVILLIPRPKAGGELGDEGDPNAPVTTQLLLKSPTEFPKMEEPEPLPPPAPPAATAASSPAEIDVGPPVSQSKTAPLTQTQQDPAPRGSAHPSHSNHPARGHKPGESYSLGTVLTSHGMVLSGDGKLSTSEVEKVLVLHLDRFESCYDHALSKNPGLSGPLMMAWVIGSGGSVHDVRIVRSRIHNAGLQQCLIREIDKLHFPSPKGGNVLVKYPFSFSVSKI